MRTQGHLETIRLLWVRRMFVETCGRSPAVVRVLRFSIRPIRPTVSWHASSLFLVRAFRTRSLGQPPFLPPREDEDEEEDDDCAQGAEGGDGDEKRGAAAGRGVREEGGEEEARRPRVRSRVPASRP